MPMLFTCPECGKTFVGKRSNRIFCSGACRAKRNGRLWLKDLTGKKFGRWTAIQVVENHDRDGATWLCECECGTQKEVTATSLLHGGSKSCGCYHKDISSKQAARLFSKPIPPGTTFGRLTVICENGRKSGSIAYLCKCECGKEKTIQSHHLKIGAIVSCGCYSVDQLVKRTTTHGLSRKPGFSRWRHQVKRDIDCNWTPDMTKAILDFQPACVLCGSIVKLSIDHVNPMSKGFALEPGNAAVLCKSCNSRKHNTLLSDLPLDQQRKLKRAAKEFLAYWKSICNC